MKKIVVRTLAVVLAAALCCLPGSGIAAPDINPAIAYNSPEASAAMQTPAPLITAGPPPTAYPTPFPSVSEDVVPEASPSVSPSPSPSLQPSGEEKVAYLTFDDGPCETGDSETQNTSAILDILAKYDIESIFFVMGAHAKKYPDLILREFNEGHLIGNHTYSHVNPETTDDDKFLRQVRSTNNVIYRITGVKPKYFRVPYAAKLTPGQRKGLHMSIIGWDLDTRDWAGESVENILAKVEKAADKGTKSLRILFHDRHAQGLEQVIQLLLDYGYTFDTIDHWHLKK